MLVVVIVIIIVLLVCFCLWVGAWVCPIGGAAGGACASGYAVVYDSFGF